MQRALFRDTMYSLFNRLETKRKRVIGERQIEILKVFFEQEEAGVFELFQKTQFAYKSIKNSTGAFFRDLSQLESLKAIHLKWDTSGLDAGIVSINLDWPQEIDEGEFLRRMKAMPKSKTSKFLS
jgi:hypothetical protein